MTSPADKDGVVVIGRIDGLFGVRGWVKVYSYTRPREGILAYNPWLLQQDGTWRPVKVVTGRPQGQGLVVNLAGYDDRDQAATLVGAEIAINHTQLPRLNKGEHYWFQLQGLRVQTLAGQDLGKVDYLFETGANDVLVVEDGERQRLIPYIPDVVRKLDLKAGIMVVDWDPDF